MEQLVGTLIGALAEAGHTLTLVPLTGQVVVLVLMVGTGVWAAYGRTRLAIVALLFCAAVWLRANSQLEGMILYTVTPAHGLTLADLLVPSLAALVLIGWAGRVTDLARRPLLLKG